MARLILLEEVRRRGSPCGGRALYWKCTVRVYRLQNLPLSGGDLRVLRRVAQELVLSDHVCTAVLAVFAEELVLLVLLVAALEARLNRQSGQTKVAAPTTRIQTKADIQDPDTQC